MQLEIITAACIDFEIKLTVSLHRSMFFEALFFLLFCTSHKKEPLSVRQGLPAADPSLSRGVTCLQIIISEKLSVIRFGPLELQTF